MGGRSKGKGNKIVSNREVTKVLICGHKGSGKSTIMKQILDRGKGQRLVDERAITYSSPRFEFKFHEFQQYKNDKDISYSMKWAECAWIGVLVVSGRYLQGTVAEANQTKNYMKLLRSLWLQNLEERKVPKLLVLVSHHDDKSFLYNESKKAVKKQLEDCGFEVENVKFFKSEVDEIVKFLDSLTNVVLSNQSCLRIDFGLELVNGSPSSKDQRSYVLDDEDLTFMSHGSKPSAVQKIVALQIAEDYFKNKEMHQKIQVLEGCDLFEAARAARAETSSLPPAFTFRHGSFGAATINPVFGATTSSQLSTLASPVFGAPGGGFSSASASSQPFVFGSTLSTNNDRNIIDDTIADDFSQLSILASPDFVFGAPSGGIGSTVTLEASSALNIQSSETQSSETPARQSSGRRKFFRVKRTHN